MIEPHLEARHATRSSAKRVMLELMSAAVPKELGAAALVAAGEVLGISENSTRVALARLLAVGTLEVTGRGSYKLGRAAQAVTRQVTSWRDLEKELRRWDGGWVLVDVGELARSDRAALHRRQRALRMLGFRALGRTVEVRPDNLVGGVGALRERLYALGLESSALVARATELDPQTEARARAAWDAEKLTASYLATRQRIERWIAADDLEPRVAARAAREAFWFGGDILRKIIYDPRLPEPLVDVAARRAMLEAAHQLDVHGRKLWARMFGGARGLPEVPRAH